MAAERTHLSIGEVLTLLQPDFPDVTISKIRFLESQGLLDPERTPSGYRKFRDADIERLRWILTQQRDHFLPLKVIKDRLTSGDLAGEGADGVLPLAAEGADAPTAPPATGDDARPEAEGADDAEPAERRASSEVKVAAANGPAPTGRASLTLLKRAGVVPDDGDDDDRHDAEGADAGGGGGGASADADDAHTRARTVARLVEAPADDDAPDGEAAEDGDAEAPAATDTPAGRGRRRHPTGRRPGEAAPPPEPFEEDRPEPLEPAQTVSLSLEELSAATGLSARELGDLERFGLLTSRSVGTVRYYDDEALVVARLAAGFGRYGIEARHLRMFKVGADREAALFEQLITPLLKQRRASARQEAVAVLEDLAELADDLRAAMVRTALRDYLGRT